MILEPLGMDRLLQFSPAEIRRQAEELREKSRHCSELAASCLTDEGKQVLTGMAGQYDGEADQLEHMLNTMKTIYAEAPMPAMQ